MMSSILGVDEGTDWRDEAHSQDLCQPRLHASHGAGASRRIAAVYQAKSQWYDDVHILSG